MMLSMLLATGTIETQRLPTKEEKLATDAATQGTDPSVLSVIMAKQDYR